MDKKGQQKKQAFTPEQDSAYEQYLKLEQEKYQNLKQKTDLTQEEKQFIQAQEKQQQFQNKIQADIDKITQLEQIQEKTPDQEKELGKLKKKVTTDDRKKQDQKFQWIKNNYEEFLKQQNQQQGENQDSKKDKKGVFTEEQEKAYQNYLDNQQKQLENLLAKSDRTKEEELQVKNYEKQKKEDEKRQNEEKLIEDLQKIEEKSPEQEKQLGKLLKAHKTQDRKKQDQKYKWIQSNSGQQQNQQQQQNQPQNQQILLSNKKEDTKKQEQQTKKQDQKQKQSQIPLSKKKSVMFEDQKNNQNKKPQKGILNQSNGRKLQRNASLILPDHLAAPALLQKRESENYHNNTHYSIVELGLKFSNDKIIGSNQRCIDYLTAVCKVIQDIQVIKNTDSEEEQDERILFCDQFGKYLDDLQIQMNSFRSINEGMKTAHNFCKNLTKQLLTSFRDVSKIVSVQKQKDWLCQQIYNFINIKIKVADQEIIKFGLDLIKEGDFIMVYARSMVIEQLLIQRYEQGINFTVIVVDNSPFFEGKKLVQVLGEKGLDCIYTPLSHCSYFIKKVTKVFVGASSMLSNGSCVSRIGTALLSCIANDYRKPFHVFCESYKFSQKSYLDSLSWNELATKSFMEDEEKQSSKKKVGIQDISNDGLNPINLRYDLTTCEHINMLITEYGKVPPHSVPHIMREFSQQQYIGRIDLPLPDNE